MVLRRISRTLISFSRPTIAWVALVIFIIFSAVVLPGQSTSAEAYIGSVGSPDLSLFYSSSDLYQMAQQYGPEGRNAYVRARFSFDLIFPIIYTFFLVTAISWLSGSIIPKDSSWRILNLVPIVGMLFDLLENTAASIVISHFPTPSPISAYLAPVFTFLKWAFVGSSFLILAIFWVFLLFTRKKK